MPWYVLAGMRDVGCVPYLFPFPLLRLFLSLPLVTPRESLCWSTILCGTTYCVRAGRVVPEGGAAEAGRRDENRRVVLPVKAVLALGVRLATGHTFSVSPWDAQRSLFQRVALCRRKVV